MSILAPCIRDRLRTGGCCLLPFAPRRGNILHQQILKVGNAHITAVHKATGDRQAMTGSSGRPSQKQCQLWRKLTLNVAAQQSGVDLPQPITGHTVIDRSVTTTAIPGVGNSVAEMLDTAGSANWRFHSRADPRCSGPGIALQAYSGRACCAAQKTAGSRARARIP